MMNRAERRRYSSLGVSNKMIMDKTLSDMYEQGFKDGIKHTYKSVITILFYVIKNHLRISKENYQSLFLRCMENIDAFRTGQLKPSDVELMKKEILEEKNLDLGRIDR